jgi:hypothetical protein
VRLFLEGKTPPKMGDVRMLESIVELLGGLFLSALTLLIGSCIVASIVAALRAVSPGSAAVSTGK